MKKTILALACMASLALLTACGGGSSKKQLKGDELKDATEKMVEQSTKGKELNKAGKAKLASLGKTEKGKRLVARDDWPNDGKIEIYIVQQDDEGDWYSEVYHFFYDTEVGRKNYNYKSYAKKSDDAGLWILTKLSTSYSSWQEAYDKCKENGYKIVE